MRVYNHRYKNRDGKSQQTKKYYLEIRDKDEVVRRIPAFEDKRASEELGRNIERLISFQIVGERPDKSLSEWVTGLPPKFINMLTNWRILESHFAAASQNIQQHLEEYLQYIRNKNNGCEHIKTVRSRINAVIGGINAISLSKINAEQVHRYLANRRLVGLSAQSSNHYLSQLKAFFNWAVSRGYLRENLLRILKPVNVKVDRRRERRAHTNNEVTKLLKAAEEGGVHYNMQGEDKNLYIFLPLKPDCAPVRLKA